MKMRAVTITSFMLLAACAGTPRQPVRDVAFKDLGDYWVMDMPMDRALMQKAPGDGGCFRARITIVADGTVSDPVVVAVSGPEGMMEWALQFAHKTHYTPAAANPTRVPVRSFMEWAFKKASDAAMSLTADQAAMLTPEQKAAAAAHKPFSLTPEQEAKFQRSAPAEGVPPTPEMQRFIDKCEADMDMQYPLPKRNDPG